MTKHLLFLLLVVFTFTATAQTDTTTANKGTVVNGTPAGNNYPFFCTLTDPIGNSTINFNANCGASLIAPQWVLTAGHCVLDIFNNFNVYDSLDVIVSPNIIGVANPNSIRLHSDLIVKHARFDLMNPDFTDDIALIHLRTPATATPIGLPAQGNNAISAAGTQVIGMGFGINDTSTLAPSDTLLMVAINIIHNDTCNTFNRHDGKVKPSMVCAGKLTGRATGNAAGDSGGPLIKEVGGTRTQVGIVSFGDGPYANAQFPGIYTKVSAYRNWIDSVIDAYERTSNVPGSKKLATIISTSHKQVTLSFNMPLPATAALFIYDLTGKMMIKTEIPARSNNYSTSLQEMSSGIYILKIALQNGEAQQHKFLVGD